MKRYTFRLQQVLDVRRRQEDLAKADLARANARVNEANTIVDVRTAHYASLPTAGAATPVPSRHRSSASSPVSCAS